jgi:hypothetical protein
MLPALSEQRQVVEEEEPRMNLNGLKILGIILIIAGVVGLAIGSFTFTKETHDADLGPIELSVKDKETVNIPVWAGVIAIVAGGLLLVIPAKKLAASN